MRSTLDPSGIGTAASPRVGSAGFCIGNLVAVDFSIDHSSFPNTSPISGVGKDLSS